jgi:hypothetical protein
MILEERNSDRINKRNVINFSIDTPKKIKKIKRFEDGDKIMS